MLCFLRQSGKLHWKDDSRVLYQDRREIPDSNIADLINDQMRSGKTFNPRGRLPFTEALKEMNVPNYRIGNPRRLNITTGSTVGKNGSRLHHTHRKKRGGYRDLCKWKTCITIHRIPEVLEV